MRQKRHLRREDQTRELRTDFPHLRIALLPVPLRLHTLPAIDPVTPRALSSYPPPLQSAQPLAIILTLMLSALQRPSHFLHRTIFRSIHRSITTMSFETTATINSFGGKLLKLQHKVHTHFTIHSNTTIALTMHTVHSPHNRSETQPLPTTPSLVIETCSRPLLPGRPNLHWRQRRRKGLLPT